MASRYRHGFRLTQIALAMSLCLQSFQPMLSPAWADQGQVVSLNNDGVKALQSSNFQLAIQKFEEALKMDPTYQLARDNLAIAHNNYGLQLRNQPKEALKQFHKALYLNRKNPTTLQNVEGIIRIMGKNPKSYQDRVDLGDQARLSGDFIGAIIEYSAALELKDDPKLHVKLGDVYRVRGEDEKAIQEYSLAARSGDSAEIELKLGQAYGANHDIPNAIQAYGRAIGYKSDDQDVLDGLVAGWNEALKENPLAPENHIGLGQALQYRGDWGGAEAEYKTALRLSVGKRNPVAEKLLGLLPAAKASSEKDKHINAGVDFQSRKLYDQAIAEYKLALAADPNNASIYVNIGTALQAKEDYDNALKAYQQAAKLDPSNAAAQQGIKTAGDQLQNKQVGEEWKAGGDLFKAGRYQEAAAKYLAVLKVTPNDAASHFSLGATYQAMKQIDEAISEYRTAIQLDPKSDQYKKALDDALDVKAAPIIQAAIALHKEKNYAAAIDKYQQALAIRPNNAELWYNVATAEYSRENYQASKTAYQKALELDPDGKFNETYFIGVIDENYGQGLDAKTQYQKYLSKAPSGVYAQQAKDRIAALTKNISDTQKIKSEAELTALKDADDNFQQAVKLQQSNQYELAVPYYKKAITLQPKNADYVYSLGTCFQQNKNIDEAVSCYQQAMNMDPNNKDYQNAYNAALELKGGPIADEAVKRQTAGDITGAVELYNQALKFMPKAARIWTNLGTALQQADDWQQARSAYQKGYDLDKKNEVGDLFLMAAIDENYNQGPKALGEYNQYIMQAGPSGTYTASAKARAAALTKNPGDVQKLQTSAEAKVSRDAGSAYDDGVKAQQAGNFDEAIADYQKAIQMNPKESAYLYAVGTAYQQKKDMTSAIQWYQKAVDMQPKNKQYQDILTAATANAAAPLMDEAVKKQQSGDAVGAIPLYERALQIMPNNARGWTNLGSAYQQAENWDKARAEYEKAISIDPKGEVDNWYFIGLLDENAGQGPKAIQDYTNYLQKGGQRATFAGQAQGRLSALRANPNSLQKITTQAETKASADAQSAYDAGVKLQQDNKLDEAIASYDKAIAATPTEPSYVYARGTAYQAKNDLDKALEDYKKAESLNPREPAYKAAIKGINQAKAAPLVNSAIDKQVNKNDPNGAIIDYQNALRLDDDASTHMNYGTALQQVNKTNEAIIEYKRAIQMDPKTCIDAHYYLATAYEAIKKPLDAVKEYSEYLRLAPTGTNAKDAHERLKVLKPGSK